MRPRVARAASYRRRPAPPALTARPRVRSALPAPGLTTGPDPAGQGQLQGGRVDRGQHPAERGRVRRHPAHRHRLIGAAGPVGDPGVRAGAGQHRPDREQQDRLQTATATPGLARIRDRGQGVQQTDRIDRVQRAGRQTSLGDDVEQGGCAREGAGTGPWLAIDGFRHLQITTGPVPPSYAHLTGATHDLPAALGSERGGCDT